MSKKRDRTHDPKPTSGWWKEADRHREAAQKNNSNGGLGAGVRRSLGGVARARPHHVGATHIISHAGRRSR